MGEASGEFCIRNAQCVKILRRAAPPLIARIADRPLAEIAVVTACRSIRCEPPVLMPLDGRERTLVEVGRVRPEP